MMRIGRIINESFGKLILSEEMKKVAPVMSIQDQFYSVGLIKVSWIELNLRRKSGIFHILYLIRKPHDEWEPFSASMLEHFQRLKDG